MSSKLCVPALLGTLLFVTSVRAELPPGSYDKLRSGVEEAVIIQVTSVMLEDGGSIVVTAKVIGIERTKAELKKGDSVTIRYKNIIKPVPGPSPVPLLDKDGVYPAFLNKKGDGFEPAAHGSSFQMTPERSK